MLSIVWRASQVAPEGTVISVGGADLDSLRAAIGAQLGKPNIQMMIWDDDFREFCRPMSIGDVKSVCTVKLVST